MADSYLRRLAANDPQLVDIRVHTDQGAEYAEALEGNTHVCKLSVRVYSHHLPENMTSWKDFCQVAGELSSLKEVRIVFEARPTLQMYLAVLLLLQQLRQVKVIYLNSYDQITDPAFGGLLAGCIPNHPSLEQFELFNFDCTRDAEQIVLEALRTVPNLKIVYYSPHPQYGDEDDDENANRLLALGRNCLGRQESITFGFIEFTPSHIEEMTSAIVSPEAQLQVIAFKYCSLPVEAAQSLLDGVARSTCLQGLSLDGATLSGTDEFARSVLSQTHLRELVVGPWDAHDPKPLLKIAAKNYHIERLEFQNSANTGAYAILKGTIDAITKLNKAGRGYLGDRSKGPECKAAGVSVLSKVSDDLDCIFYHLRENPLLCDLGCRHGGASEKRPAGILGTATSQQEEGRDIMPLRRSKKRRTSTEEP